MRCDAKDLLRRSLRGEAAPVGSPLGQRYAALCAACSMAERVRDEGAHSLVVLDDVSCMVRPCPTLRADFPRDRRPAHGGKRSAAGKLHLWIMILHKPCVSIPLRSSSS